MLSFWLAQILGKSLFVDRLFRIGASALLGFFLVFFLLPIFIKFLQKKGAIADFNQANSTPIFGGVLLILTVLLSSLCFSQMNGYSISTLAIMVLYFLVGFIDDWVKIKNKKLFLAGKLDKKSYQDKTDGISPMKRLVCYFLFSLVVCFFTYKYTPQMTTNLTIPFVKPSLWYPALPVLAYILLMSFVTTSTANGANFTDGLDTLIAVPIICSCIFIGAVAYASGNFVISSHLLLPYLPGVDELVPICAAICGTTLAYIWYNCPPAQIYLGDSGSIGLGGAIGLMFVLIKAEFFLPLICIIFLAEAVSVVIQISFFKLTRRFCSDHKGRRIFLKAPIHHHFVIKGEKKYGSLEAAKAKVTWKFHIVSVVALIVGALVFFKIR